MKEEDIKILKKAFAETKLATYLGRATENDENTTLCRNLLGFGRRIAYLVLEELYGSIFSKEKMDDFLEIIISGGEKKPTPTEKFDLTEEKINEINNIIHTQFRILSTFTLQRTGTGACHEMTDDLLSRLAKVSFKPHLIIAKGKKPIDHKFMIAGIDYQAITNNGFLDWQALKKSNAMVGDPWLNEDILAAKDINNEYYTGKYSLIPIENIVIDNKEFEKNQKLYNDLFEKKLSIFPLHFIGYPEKWELENHIQIQFDFKAIEISIAFNHLERCLKNANNIKDDALRQHALKGINEKVELLANKLSLQLQDEHFKTKNPNPFAMLAFVRSRCKIDKKKCAELCIEIYKKIKHDTENNQGVLKNLLTLIKHLSSQTLDESFKKQLNAILNENERKKPLPKVETIKSGFLLVNKPKKKPVKESDHAINIPSP